MPDNQRQDTKSVSEDDWRGNLERGTSTAEFRRQPTLLAGVLDFAWQTAAAEKRDDSEGWSDGYEIPLSRYH